MKVLVMGGTQFNGLALVRELAKYGHDVTVLNRGKTAVDLPHGVKRLYADRTDAAALKAALGAQEFDCVQDVNAYRPEDVKLMREVFHGRTGHYVFVSSTVIYAASELLPISEDSPVDRSPQQNEYGRLKLECEDFLFREHRAHGFPATVVALSMVFGPSNVLPDREQRMFARLRAGRPILIPGDGSTLAQVGHVEDQARALRMLMANPKSFGRRYNLTGADYFSADGYVDAFAAILGVTPNKVYVPASLMDDLYSGRVSLTRKTEVQSNIDIRGTERPDEVMRTRFMLTMLVQRIAPHLHWWNKSVVFSVERMRRDVGWEPEFSFPAAVEHTWRWFQQQGLHETAKFDFGAEEQLLALVKERS